MRRKIARFLQYLHVERGASPHTIKSYREDLETFLDFFLDDDSLLIVRSFEVLFKSGLLSVLSSQPIYDFALNLH
jgi:site-specific recombinase XerD